MPKPSSADPAELAKFAAMADEWWDASGPLAPLHAMNPARLAVIRAEADAHFALDPGDITPFSGLRVLDIGCGGGLTAEPMARLGASVTAIDAQARSIAVARLHAGTHGLDIDYRETTPEAVRAEGESPFDLVLAMEIVEHVADPDSFLADCASLVAPGGLLIMATLNRTIKALFLAILGAEYVLGWLPRGTHRFDRFLRPHEAQRALRAAGLSADEPPIGMVYHPLSRCWTTSTDADVNFMLTAKRASLSRSR